MTNKPTIGLIGAFQNGKSTLVNCLFGRELAKVGGKGLSVTCVNTRFTYGCDNSVDFVRNHKIISSLTLEDYLNHKIELPTDISEIIVRYNDDLLESFDIIDTPGFNANDSDSYMAEAACQEIDFAIFIIRNKGLSQYEIKIAQLLNRYSIPFFILINTYDEGEDLWNPKADKNKTISRNVWHSMKNSGIKPTIFDKNNSIIIVNLIWFWLSLFPDNENKSIRLCQRKLRYFWEEYFNVKLSERSLHLKSNFNALLYKLTQESFIKCAVSSKVRKVQLNRIHYLINKFDSNWKLTTLKIKQTYPFGALL